jgi:NAD(P)-dependent dehydrogenase (short-subunit alcohol dehydrogenase family)
MRRILVTGGNKGIGLAIVQAILEQDSDTFVYLGSRDRARGDAAAAGLVEKHGAWKDRLAVLALDVASDASVTAAARHVEALSGIVNNAGIGSGASLSEVLQTNVLGIHRVCDAFLPHLAPTGRIVNVTSASGPIFVAGCSAERQRFFLDGSASWATLRAFVDECLSHADDPAALRAMGLGDAEAYGLSKACANLYTMILAREHPGLHVNACTPGFIDTDLTRKHFVGSGKSAAELGMKTPAEGAKAPLHLLFAPLEGNGRFYGSDAQRSPLDRYRAPGSPAFVGP